MLSKSATILNRIASATTGTSTSRLAFATATVFLASTSVSLAAYSFLTVSGNNVGGNGAFSQFSGTNGTIPVSHSFSAGGAGPSDNINSAIFPSNFSAIPGFAGAGNVQGHLGQTLYGNTSVVTFTMNYTISSTSTVFGMWNTTDEVAQPAYRIELIDASNNAVPPTSFVTFGTGGNAGTGQPNGRHQMVLNTATGDISAGATINGGVGIHTNALFWTGIPSSTKMIKVYGNLGALAGNNQGDGVGYYFAELAVPEPTSVILIALGMFSLAAIGKRRR